MGISVTDNTQATQLEMMVRLHCARSLAGWNEPLSDQILIGGSSNGKTLDSKSKDQDSTSWPPATLMP